MEILIQRSIVPPNFPMVSKLDNSIYFNRDTEDCGTSIRSIFEHKYYYLFASSNHQEETHFNPLKLPDTLNNRQFNSELLKQLCKNNEEDDAVETIIIEQLKYCVDYAYSKLPQNHRTLSNATKILPKHFSRWVELRRWLRSDGKYSEGKYAYIFDNKDDEFDLKLRRGFNLHHFFNREPQHIQTPVAMYLLYRIDLASYGLCLNKTLH